MIYFRLFVAAVVMALLPTAAVTILHDLGVPVGGDPRHWYVGFVAACLVVMWRKGRG